MWRGLFLLFALPYCSSARLPSFNEYHLALEDDIASIESLHRHIRASLPIATEVADLLADQNPPKRSADIKKPMKNTSGKSAEGGLYKTYGSDAEGEKGYFKETYSNDDQGYKSLDSFHKKDGDSYAFEKHVSYGKAQGDRNGDDKASSGSSDKKTDDHHSADSISDTRYAEAEGDQVDGATKFSHYTTGGGDSNRYFADYGTRYTNEPELYSYKQGEAYSAEDGTHDPYESHGSYSVINEEDDGDHR